MTEFVTASWPVERLIEYARNPRKNDHAVDALASAIREFGFRVPIVAKSDGTVVDGHLRLKAAKKLGLEEVPVLLADDMTDAQIKAFRLSVNKVSELAEWDIDLLKLELQDLIEMDFDLDLTGFGPDELKDLLAPPDVVGMTGDDDVPELPEAPTTVDGDIWLLGKHRLVCGDSTSVDTLLELCDGHNVDMWLTDPPYNVAYTGKTKEALTIQNDEMGDDQFRQFLRDSYSAADAVMRPGAVFYIWHADSEGYNFRGAAHDVEWQVRQCLIWKKQTMVMGRQDYQWKHEPCLYGWKSGAAHTWVSDRKQTTVLEFDRHTRNAEHPTMKPVDLISYQMLNNTRPGDKVLDSFAGSGTIAICAEKHNRVAYMVELDPRYCDVTIRRWQEFTGKQAIHEKTGKTYDELKGKEVAA